MTYPGSENDYSKKAPELSYGSQTDVRKAEIGGKKAVRVEKVVVRDTKTGRVYGSRAIAQKPTSSSPTSEHAFPTIFNLLYEAEESSVHGLPAKSINTIKSNIRKGAQDTDQQWKDAIHLTDKAYKVLSFEIPSITDKQAWKQYETMIQYAVRQLYMSRGLDGSWRKGSSAITEDISFMGNPSDAESTTASPTAPKRFVVTVNSKSPYDMHGSTIEDVIDQIQTAVKNKDNCDIKVRTYNPSSAKIEVIRNGKHRGSIDIKSVD